MSWLKGGAGGLAGWITSGVTPKTHTHHQLSRRLSEKEVFSLSVLRQPIASLLPSVSVRLHRLHATRAANGRPKTCRASANQRAVAMLEAESIRGIFFFPWFFFSFFFFSLAHIIDGYRLKATDTVACQTSCRLQDWAFTSSTASLKALQEHHKQKPNILSVDCVCFSCEYESLRMHGHRVCSGHRKARKWRWSNVYGPG